MSDRDTLFTNWVEGGCMGNTYDRKETRIAQEGWNACWRIRDAACAEKDARIRELEAGLAQLEADRTRLIKERDTQRLALQFIAGPVKRTPEEMRELAQIGLNAALSPPRQPGGEGVGT